MTNKTGKTGSEAGAPDSHTPTDPSINSPLREDASAFAKATADKTAGMAGQALRRLAEERLKEKQRGQGSEVRSQRSEVGSQKAEVGSQKAEVGGQKAEVGGQRSEEDTTRLVHELEVHQIELEMQNEELRQTRAKAEQLIRELQTALANVKLLSGLLPICTACKKIRNDKGYWKQLEAYIESHSEATFTHGMCPDCLEEFRKEVDAGVPETAATGTPAERTYAHAV